MRKKEFKAFNYCVCFIDLLGQRNGYKDEGLIPQFNNNEEREAFSIKIKQTIGSIIKLQKDAENFMNELLSSDTSKENFSQNFYDIYDQMIRCNVRGQRWSDGLIYFVSLGDQEVKCPVNAPFNLFGLAGSMVFLGLARRQPIRGAIDIAWGMELYEGELYGAVVAKAYELESNVAKYPRIVVSDRVIEYLHIYKDIPGDDKYSEFNRKLAYMCIKMLTKDVDGYIMISYLGKSFRDYKTKGLHKELYNKALQFIQEEYERHRGERNSKLSFRYSHLNSYFLAHPLED